jgi:hypothetical protein
VCLDLMERGISECRGMAALEDRAVRWPGRGRSLSAERTAQPDNRPLGPITDPSTVLARGTAPVSSDVGGRGDGVAAKLWETERYFAGLATQRSSCPRLFAPRM